MAHGKLVAQNTTEAIKKVFGIGYKIILTPKDNVDIKEFVAKKKNIDDLLLANDVISEYEDSIPRKPIYLIQFESQKEIHSILSTIEEKLPFCNIDVELSNLEDAYLNMTKTTEKYFTNPKANKDLEKDPQYYEHLRLSFDTESKKSSLKSIYAIFWRKSYIFFRDSKSWFVTLSPIFFAITLFIILDKVDQIIETYKVEEMKDKKNDMDALDKYFSELYLLLSLVKGVAFSFFSMTGFAIVSSLFTLSILTDKKQKMQYI